MGDGNDKGMLVLGSGYIACPGTGGWADAKCWRVGGWLLLTRLSRSNGRRHCNVVVPMKRYVIADQKPERSGLAGRRRLTGSFHLPIVTGDIRKILALEGMD